MKRIITWVIGAILVSAGLASASFLGDFLNAGIDPQGGSLTFNKSMVSSTANASIAGPTDDLDVSGVNVVKVDTSSANVTIGGFVGGEDGQILEVVVTDSTNDATLENNEGTSNQDAYLNSGSDDTLSASYGGWTLVCDGSSWYEVAN